MHGHGGEHAARVDGPAAFGSTSTVLEMASTPVSDEPPLANARSNTKIVAPITSPLPW